MNKPRKQSLWVMRQVLALLATTALVVGVTILFFDDFQGLWGTPPGRIIDSPRTAPLTVPLSTPHWPGEGN